MTTEADTDALVQRVYAALNSGRDEAVVRVVLDETDALRAEVERLWDLIRGHEAGHLTCGNADVSHCPSGSGVPACYSRVAKSHNRRSEARDLAGMGTVPTGAQILGHPLTCGNAGVPDEAESKTVAIRLSQPPPYGGGCPMGQHPPTHPEVGAPRAEEKP